MTESHINRRGQVIYEGHSIILGPVVRRVDSAIHWIVIFLNFLKVFFVKHFYDG